VTAVPTLSILMPVFDERELISRALETVLGAELPFDYELVVVDDGSRDGTSEVLRAYSWPPHARLFEHGENRGKGAAVQTALSHARGRFSAIFDADLEYDVRDLPVLVEPLESGRARAAFGVRAFDGYSSHSFWFVLGNRAVTLAANLLFNVYLHDLMTGQKVIETELFRELPLRARGFEIEPEIAARLIQRGERIYELPVRYQARSHAEGKKLVAADGFRVLATLLRCRFSGR
jgi:glycosyltransferase involved in cell wall biosynthesis